VITPCNGTGCNTNAGTERHGCNTFNGKKVYEKGVDEFEFLSHYLG
jgi:hypothetical protein